MKQHPTRYHTALVHWGCLLGCCLLAITLEACGGLSGYECQSAADCPTQKRCSKGWCQFTPEPPQPRTIPTVPLPEKCQPGEVLHCQSSASDTPLKGICQAGTRRCIQGIWSDCIGEIKPSVELCDGLDNNCDGQIDEGNVCAVGECTNDATRPCYSGDAKTRNTGTCKDGSQRCTNHRWGPCLGMKLPTKEACNGIDDNCDGQIDEQCHTCTPNQLTGQLGVEPVLRRGILAQNNDGTIIAQGWPTSRSIQLWNAETSQPIRALQTNQYKSNYVVWFAFHPTSQEILIVYRHQQNHLQLWNAVEGTFLRQIPLPASALGVKRFALQPQGQWLALLDNQGTLHLLTLLTEQWSQLTKEEPISGFAFHPLEAHLIYLTTILKRWDLAAQRSLGPMWIPGDPKEIHYLRSEDALLMWYPGKTIQIREMATGKTKASLSAAGLTHITLDAKHENLYMLDIQGILRRYHFATAVLSKGFSACVMPGSLLLVANEAHAAASCADGRVKQWHLVSGQPQQQTPPVLHIHTANIQTLAFAPGSTTLASGDAEGTIKVWDVAQPQQTPQTLPHKSSLIAMAWSPDNKTLVSSTTDQLFHVWDITTGVERLPGKLHEKDVQSIHFHPDGKRVASSDLDGNVKLWELQTGKLLHTWQTPPGQSVGLFFDKNGQTLFAGAQDGHVYVWDIASRTEKARFLAHNSAIMSLDLSLDGLRLATISQDRSIKLWDWARQELIYVERPANLTYTHVVFRPESEHMVATREHMLTLWNRKGTQLSQWQAHDQKIQSIAVQSDGAALATTGQDQMIKIWRCP